MSNYRGINWVIADKGLLNVSKVGRSHERTSWFSIDSKICLKIRHSRLDTCLSKQFYLCLPPGIPFYIPSISILGWHTHTFPHDFLMVYSWLCNSPSLFILSLTLCANPAHQGFFYLLTKSQSHQSYKYLNQLYYIVK